MVRRRGAVISVILGSVTAVGGGALRDICVSEVPRAFQPGKYYAISSFVGSACYIVPIVLGAPLEIASVLCVADHFNWHTHGNTLSER